MIGCGDLASADVAMMWQLRPEGERFTSLTESHTYFVDVKNTDFALILLKLYDAAVIAAAMASAGQLKTSNFQRNLHHFHHERFFRISDCLSI